ncbi:MAG: hypothetical protein WAW90_00765, partial [Minisyncoccia bacterium]
ALQSIVTSFAFYESLEFDETGGPTSLVVLSFIAVGFLFFMMMPRLYTGVTTEMHKRELSLLLVIEIISIVVLMAIPFVATFYSLVAPPLYPIFELVPMVLAYVGVQYLLARHFSLVRVHA